VLQGSARYYERGRRPYGRRQARGDHAAARRVLLVRGHEQGAARAGADRLPGGARDASGRLNIRGETMPGDSKENKQVPVVVRDGEFFE